MYQIFDILNLTKVAKFSTGNLYYMNHSHLNTMLFTLRILICRVS